MIIKICPLPALQKLPVCGNADRRDRCEFHISVSFFEQRKYIQFQFLN